MWSSIKENTFLLEGLFFQEASIVSHPASRSIPHYDFPSRRTYQTNTLGVIKACEQPFLPPRDVTGLEWRKHGDWARARCEASFDALIGRDAQPNADATLVTNQRLRSISLRRRRNASAWASIIPWVELTGHWSSMIESRRPRKCAVVLSPVYASRARSHVSGHSPPRTAMKSNVVLRRATLDVRTGSVAASAPAVARSFCRVTSF